MIVRQVDAQNDWTFGKGFTNYLRDEAAIEQNIKSRLLSWLNDCFFALDEGVDWRGRLDVGQDEALEDEIKSILLQSYGVIGVDSILSSFDHTVRTITITYSIQTIFGSVFQSIVQQTVN